MNGMNLTKCCSYYPTAAPTSAPTPVPTPAPTNNPISNPTHSLSINPSYVIILLFLFVVIATFEKNKKTKFEKNLICLRNMIFFQSPNEIEGLKGCVCFRQKNTHKKKANITVVVCAVDWTQPQIPNNCVN